MAEGNAEKSSSVRADSFDCVSMTEIFEEVAMRVVNENTDDGQCMVVGKGKRKYLRESGNSSLESETLSAVTVEAEIASLTSSECVVSSPVPGLVETSTEPNRAESSGVRLNEDIPEPLQGLGEVYEYSALDSPFSLVVSERSCGQFESPSDSALIPAAIDWSDQENPGFWRSPERDAQGLRTVLRAPLKPARMSVLNRIESASSVRRRLRFDGL